jgi:hypothetical protein
MKMLLLALFVLISMSLLSQTNDTIILKTGEIIPCKIDNISKSGVVSYYYTDSTGNSVMTQSSKTFIQEIIKPDSLFTLEKAKYKTWISIYSSSDALKGTLCEIKDSSILIAGHSLAYPSSDISEMINLHINDIETIKVRRSGKIGLGCLIGAAAGLATGLTIGLIHGDDPEDYLIRFSAADYALIYGISCMVGGAGIGAAIGSLKIKIPINGSMDTFNKEKSRLRKYSIK